MKHYIYSKILYVFVVVVVLLPGITTVGKASGGGQIQDDASRNIFCVSEAPRTNSFPQVGLDFRVIDQNINPINNISDEDIKVSENGQPSFPLSSGMKVNDFGLGIDFYVLVDRGNRTDQDSIKNVLNTLFNYYDQSRDQVFIYTNEGNKANTYFNPSSSTTLLNAINDYPTAKIGRFRVLDTAVETVLVEIEGSFNECQKPKFLFLVLGDTAISENKILEVVQRAKSSFTKVVIFHAPAENGALDLEASYRSLAESAGGYYASLPNGGEQLFFNSLAGYRQSYSANYRSAISTSGDREIAFVFKGATLNARGDNVYSVAILPPQVTLVIPSTIERTATEVVNTDYIYDDNEGSGSITARFPDNLPRKIDSAVLIISRTGQPDLRVPVNITAAGENYQFKWSLGELENIRRSDLIIKAEVVDELGTVVVSPDVQVAVLSFIPPTRWLERYLNYVLIGFVVLLLVIMAVMWRRMGKVVSNVRQGVTNVVGFVRKTIVGGGRRGKPLATLKLIEGPQSMIGQELKIYTEIVKLGRDPKLSDLTFYTPDAISSVSGLHVILERVSGSWRLVAVSQSRSETFVDNHAIPFNDPVDINPGQLVRLGYPAQQPVVFEFQSQKSTLTEIPDPRRTDVGEKTTPVDLIKINKEKEQKLKKDASEGKNSLFDEYLD